MMMVLQDTATRLAAMSPQPTRPQRTPAPEPTVTFRRGSRGCFRAGERTWQIARILSGPARGRLSMQWAAPPSDCAAGPCVSWSGGACAVMTGL